MNLLKTAAAVSSLTLLSRVTGLLRETLTAGLFGAGAQTDAFFVAFRLPNLLRRLFAEGAFSQAFVPVLGQVKAQQGDSEASRLASEVALLLSAVLAAVTLLAIVGAPLLVWLMTGGFAGDSARFDLAVSMTQWMFPYIILISLVALAAGVLNTWSEFKLPAFTPVLLNVSFIGCALLLAPALAEPIWALVVAVLVGGVCQLGLQVWGLHRLGLLLTLRSLLGQPLQSLRQAWSDPHVRRVLTLMAPASLAVSVAQVSLIINTHIAAGLATGSVSWLSYADRLMEFPTALVGVALGTVLLPSLAKAHGEKDMERASSLLDWGLRMVVVLTLPAALGLAALAEPLTACLFHYGAFTNQDLGMTAQAMVAYSVGLLGLIAVKVLAPGFYAQQNIRTPVKIALLTLVFTQLLNLALVPVFAHAGLALATGLAACLNAALLFVGLKRSGGFVPQPGWLGLLLKSGFAACAMAAFLVWGASHFDWAGLRVAPLTRILALSGLLVGAALIYFGLLTALRLPWRTLIRGPK
ncbi:MAG: murein biosynthesis integral membrane protein MurJ [Betaproteobacteria bacterium]|nr:murein biosynthesis integral membrane protein MurJ [Betaproteobacteria bacterium]NBY14191.1 murein biosynthesis integral membrane protein MurJ [Betaproteobacteria bacterium]